MVTGLHHITAIAGDPQRNYDFYTNLLGLRLVKKTVNFDDPGTYHLYYGDQTGSPGSILTFFPWTQVKQGKNGVGMATEIGYSVPSGSLEFWKDRFEKRQVTHDRIDERFGERFLAFTDPDGLWLSLVEPQEQDQRTGWLTGDLTEDVAIKGFHSVILTLNSIDGTEDILSNVFDYEKVGKDGNIHRFKTVATENAAIVDLLLAPGALPGVNAGGTNHHVAFRVKNEEMQAKIREKIVEKGLYITEKIDRSYFFSLYFREPGGVLFEVATDTPGFLIDETVEELGTDLKLPERYEPIRARIEKQLPELKIRTDRTILNS